MSTSCSWDPKASKPHLKPLFFKTGHILVSSKVYFLSGSPFLSQPWSEAAGWPRVLTHPTCFEKDLLVGLAFTKPNFLSHPCAWAESLWPPEAAYCNLRNLPLKNVSTSCFTLKYIKYPSHRPIDQLLRLNLKIQLDKGAIDLSMAAGPPA